MTSINDALNLLEEFERGSLRARISSLETSLQGADASSAIALLQENQIATDILLGAISIKRLVGQINVLIHTLGIVLSLPHILEEGEVIESLSLGAGNTGRKFDLETTRRVAEFKFINWRGGADTIRENSLFKDFYYLAEYETAKSKYLYVIGENFPLKFLNGGRSLKNVMSRNSRLWKDFSEKYGDRFQRVREYYEYRKSLVYISDISQIVPQFSDDFGLTVVEE